MSTNRQLDISAFGSQLRDLCNKYNVIIEGGLDFGVIVRDTPYVTTLLLQSTVVSTGDEVMSAFELDMWESTHE